VPKDKSIAFGEATKTDAKLEITRRNVPREQQCRWLEDPANLGFEMESSSPWVEYRYYGLVPTGACDSDLCNKQPRLIIHYYDNPDKHANRAANWPQGRHDPQQTSQMEWRSYPDFWGPGDKKLRAYYDVKNRDAKLAGFTGLSFPLIYDDQVILGAQQVLGSNNYKSSILALGSNGDIAWNWPLSGTVKPATTIDQDGHLYVVTETRLCILNADTGLDVQSGQPPMTLAPNPEVDRCKKLDDLIGKNISIQNAPTVGAGGTLYLPTAQGLFAVSRYPNLKVLWTSALSTGSARLIGTPALNHSESTLFVATSAGTLYAIDTTDGTTRWTANVPIGATAPVPVVAMGNNGESLVFLAVKDKPLNVFRDNDCAIPVSGTSTCGTVGPAHTSDAPTSQVVIDSDFARASSPASYAYYVKQPEGGRGQLCWLNNALAASCRGFDPSDARESWSDRKFSLSSSSLLAADGRGNIYIMDWLSDPQNVLQFTAPGQGKDKTMTGGKLYMLSRVRKNEEGRSTNFGNDNLLLGPDGTLYNVNGDHLFVLQPRGLLDSLTLNKENGETANQTGFLARQTITVEKSFRLEKWSTTILEAGQQINFQPEFSVPLGAELRCRINVTLK